MLTPNLQLIFSLTNKYFWNISLVSYLAIVLDLLPKYCEQV